MPLTDCVMIKALKKLCHFEKLLENSETFLSPLRWHWGLLKFSCTKKTPKAETKPNPRQEKIYYSFTSKRVFACDWVTWFTSLLCHFPTSQVKCLRCQIACYFREGLLLFCLFSFWPWNLVQRYLFWCFHHPTPTPNNWNIPKKRPGFNNSNISDKISFTENNNSSTVLVMCDVKRNT